MDKFIFQAQLNGVDTLVKLRIMFTLKLAGEQTPNAIEGLRSQMNSYFKEATAQNKCVSVMAICKASVAGIGSPQIPEQPDNFKNQSGKWAFIMNLYTLPEYRKRGICFRILNRLVEEVAKIGITPFELHATPAGEPVYLKNGFTIHNEPPLRQFV